MDIDCLAHKRWIMFLVLYQNGSRMAAAHNWKVLALSWSDRGQSGGFVFFPCLSLPSFLPSPAPVYRHLDLWAWQQCRQQQRGVPADRQTCIYLWQIDSSALSCLPACLSPCWSAPLRSPISQRKTKLNKSATFDRCLRSSCLSVLTKTPTYCKQQHWK